MYLYTSFLSLTSPTEEGIFKRLQVEEKNDLKNKERKKKRIKARNRQRARDKVVVAEGGFELSAKRLSVFKKERNMGRDNKS